MKDFTLYPEALALKELGFNEPCFGFWNYNDSKMYYWNDEEIQNERTNKWFLDTEKKFPKISKNGCTAPTFSQAFRWFREKHGLDSWIEEINHGIDNVNKRYVFQVPTPTSHLNKVIFFDTYEEAELDCLKYLIKAVKEKQNGRNS